MNSQQAENAGNALALSHADFQKKWHDGRLYVHVNTNMALEVIRASRCAPDAPANLPSLPKRYVIAHYFWTFTAILGWPIAIGLLFYKWWLALIVFFITPAIGPANLKSMQEFMIDHSLEDPTFYQKALDIGLIRITEK